MSRYWASIEVSIEAEDAHDAFEALYGLLSAVFDDYEVVEVHQ